MGAQRAEVRVDVVEFDGPVCGELSLEGPAETDGPLAVRHVLPADDEAR